jgi:hypothetical protein
LGGCIAKIKSLKKVDKMKPKKEEIPEGFSGLTYAPSSENAFYMLLGLLSPYLQSRLRFEKFEISPLPKKNEYGRRISASGEYYTDERWEKATFELSILSSSYSRKKNKQSDSDAVFLICWMDDAAKRPDQIRKVISLLNIFDQVPMDLRQRIILHPNRIAKLPDLIDEDHIDQFSAANSIKVQRLLLRWPYHQRSGVFHLHSGHLEILLTLFGTGEASIRACVYEKGEYLGVDKHIYQHIRSEFDTSKFRIEETGKRVNIWLHEMRIEDVDRLADLVAKDITSEFKKGS